MRAVACGFGTLMVAALVGAGLMAFLLLATARWLVRQML